MEETVISVHDHILVYDRAIQRVAPWLVAVELPQLVDGVRKRCIPLRNTGKRNKILFVDPQALVVLENLPCMRHRQNAVKIRRAAEERVQQQQQLLIRKAELGVSLFQCLRR